MNQESLSDLLSQGLVKGVVVSEGLPSKGKALFTPNKRIWTVSVILVNGNESKLLSTRGSPREWASLDKLTEWLKGIGLNNYQVNQKGI